MVLKYTKWWTKIRHTKIRILYFNFNEWQDWAAWKVAERGHDMREPTINTTGKSSLPKQIGCIPSKEQHVWLRPLCPTAMKLLLVSDEYTSLLVRTNPTPVTTVPPILLWTSSSSHSLSLESRLTLVGMSFSLQVSATG